MFLTRKLLETWLLTLRFNSKDNFVTIYRIDGCTCKIIAVALCSSFLVHFTSLLIYAKDEEQREILMDFIPVINHLFKHDNKVEFIIYIFIIFRS